MKQRVVLCMQVLFLCFLAAIPSRAQVANNTSLAGTVTDANGVVMGAKVTAVNARTNDTYSATTDEQGNYSITFVREGTYSITAEQVGFRKSVQNGILVENNRTVRTDIRLELGSVSQSAVVNAAVPPISTEEATLAETINSRSAVGLPLNGRDTLKLAAATSNVIIGPKSSTPILTDEDVYLKEPFRVLRERHAVGKIHPDLATSGGILETHKIGNMAEEYGVPMAVPFAGTPVSSMANVHCAAATQNFLALENHSLDVPWWSSMVQEGARSPIVDHGWIDVPDRPGLGVTLNEDVVRQHLQPGTGYFEPTTQWDHERSWDRLWS